tara:strand:- start:2089 stop:2850 length:762 start_codon:yes stop_codon:yes gene_type:complete
MTSSFQSKLNYRVFGSGYPVVFLHGFLESLSMWEQLNFKDKFQCIEIDFPGHGDSEVDDGQNFEMSHLAIEVKGLLIDLGVERYSIVGHSMGGYVGLELMRMDKNSSKLVLLNSNFWNDSDQKVKDRVRVAKIVRQNKNIFLYEAIPKLFCNPELFNVEVKALIENAKQISSEAMVCYSLSMSNRKNNREVVEQRAKDVFVVQGEFDDIVPEELMKRQLNGLECESIVLSGCGHMCHVEAPDQIVNAITLFLG